MKNHKELLASVVLQLSSSTAEQSEAMSNPNTGGNCLLCCRNYTPSVIGSFMIKKLTVIKVIKTEK